MSDTGSTDHVHGFVCAETERHADEASKREELARRYPTHPNAANGFNPTPLYDGAAWASGFAPLPEVTA